MQPGVDLSFGTLAASLIVSGVGFGLFIYGKREVRGPQLLTGLTLMVYPYFVSGPLAMYAIAVLLVGGMVLALRQGM